MTPDLRLKPWLLSSLFLCVFASCASYKNISYFKNVETTPEVYTNGQDIQSATFESLKVQPDDLLNVTINTLDPGFNGIAHMNASLGAAPITTGYSSVSITGDKYTDGYLVNQSGEIDLPVLGRVSVNGLTIDEVKNSIAKKAAVYYKNATVNVRLLNFRVTVLGEVTRPGTYTVNEERVSVLDALGLSGDLTIYGKRENIMLIRQQANAQKKVVRMNLNDANMMNSPYFYLKQGDVIYVEPGKGKAAATDMAATRTYAIAGSALAVLITLISRINF